MPHFQLDTTHAPAIREALEAQASDLSNLLAGLVGDDRRETEHRLGATEFALSALNRADDTPDTSAPAELNPPKPIGRERSDGTPPDLVATSRAPYHRFTQGDAERNAFVLDHLDQASEAVKRHRAALGEPQTDIDAVSYAGPSLFVNVDDGEDQRSFYTVTIAENGSLAVAGGRVWGGDGMVDYSPADVAKASEAVRERLSGGTGEALTHAGAMAVDIEGRFLGLDLERENFAALWLDTRHRPLGFEVLFLGTVDSATVHAREVLKSALRHNAAACVLAHNHPSGVSEPSENDRAITAKLRDGLETIDVRLLDHFVLGETGPVSMAKRGLI
jgi:hypothetical protein